MTTDTSPRVDIYLDTHGDAESATLRLPELTECEAACVGQPRQMNFPATLPS